MHGEVAHLHLKALEIFHDLGFQLSQQIVFIAEMVVERAAVEVGSLAQIVHREASKLRSSISSMSASRSARFERRMRRSCGAAVHRRADWTAAAAGETVVVVMITSIEQLDQYEQVVH